jgi:peptidoglycan/LPS O-acetylase OafA/YrhL
VLRLVPALWLCTGLTLVMLFSTGFLASVDWEPWTLGAWLVCQSTVFQYWNPDFLRGFGCGVVNGSLWTISVEIQFYCALVLLYLGLRRLSAQRFDAAIVALVLLFGAANQWKFAVQSSLDTALGSETAGKLFLVSFIPWFFMFLLGVLAQRHAASIVPWTRRYRWAIIGSTAGAIIACKYGLGVAMGNYLPAPLVPLLGCCILSLAYSSPGLSDRILGGNDVSYGIYIFHMPIVNFALWRGGMGSMSAIVLTMAMTAAISVLSWRFIERPFLRRKRESLRATGP